MLHADEQVEYEQLISHVTAAPVCQQKMLWHHSCNCRIPYARHLPVVLMLTSNRLQLRHHVSILIPAAKQGGTVYSCCCCCLELGAWHAGAVMLGWGAHWLLSTLFFHAVRGPHHISHQAPYAATHDPAFLQVVIKDYALLQMCYFHSGLA